MAATWLDAGDVVTAIGDDLADQVNTAALQTWCDAARDFVEERRPDLWVDTDADGTVDDYQPTPAVKSGTALLAYRLYQRRKSPLGVMGVTNDQASGILRDDPDIEKLLGIGRRRRFGFGAPRTQAVV